MGFIFLGAALAWFGLCVGIGKYLQRQDREIDLMDAEKRKKETKRILHNRTKEHPEITFLVPGKGFVE